MVVSVVGRLKVSEGRFGRVLVAFMATALLLLQDDGTTRRKP